MAAERVEKAGADHWTQPLSKVTVGSKKGWGLVCTFALTVMGLKEEMTIHPSQQRQSAFS